MFMFIFSKGRSKHTKFIKKSGSAGLGGRVESTARRMNFLLRQRFNTRSSCERTLNMGDPTWEHSKDSIHGRRVKEHGRSAMGEHGGKAKINIK